MRLIDQELRISGRRLPHWQAGASTYFVTFTSHINLDPSSRQIVCDCIRKGEVEHFNLFIGCVMPDHAHLLLFPREVEPGKWRSLSHVMKGLKGASSRAVNKGLGRKGSLWQDESFDRIIRNAAEYRGAWNYIWQNPIEAGLANHPEEYPFLLFPSEDSAKHILG